jgi:hypothetical protein
MESNKVMACLRRFSEGRKIENARFLGRREFTGNFFIVIFVDSTQNSRGRGSQFINIGHGNQEQ